MEGGRDTPPSERGWRCAADGRRFADETRTQQLAKGIVNKITQGTLEAMADQMGEMVNRFVDTGDDDAMADLNDVINILYDTAVESDAPRDKHLVTLYARFAYEVVLREASFVAQKTGKEPTVGTSQFRKRLVTKVQTDFECFQKEYTRAGADLTAVTRRQAHGNINYIGQLYNQKLITERIVLLVCQRLLGGRDEVPSEENLELLFQLLRAAGKRLDESQSQLDAIGDVFSRLDALSKDARLSKRCSFRIADVLELRGRGWQVRRK